MRLNSHNRSTDPSGPEIRQTRGTLQSGIAETQMNTIPKSAYGLAPLTMFCILSRVPRLRPHPLQNCRCMRGQDAVTQVVIGASPAPGPTGFRGIWRIPNDGQIFCSAERRLPTIMDLIAGNPSRLLEFIYRGVAIDPFRALEVSGCRGHNISDTPSTFMGGRYIVAVRVLLMSKILQQREVAKGPPQW